LYKLQFQFPKSLNGKYLDSDGLELKEAKDLVDGAPKPIKEGVYRAEADEIAAKLKEAGADVEIA
jgi:large subunit ribosomal protein L7/L12